MNVGELLDKLGAFLKWAVVRFQEIVTSPRVFAETLARGRKDELMFASQFAVVLSIVGLIIQSPMLRARGVQFESQTYLVLDTIVTYFHWFLAGAVFHGIARLLGTRATLNTTVTAYLYLQAFSVLIELAGLLEMATPLGRMVLTSPADLLTTMKNAEASLATDITPYLLFLLSAIPLLVLVVYRFACMVIVFQRIHALSRLRCILIVLIAKIADYLLFWGIFHPITLVVWESYHGQAMGK